MLVSQSAAPDAAADAADCEADEVTMCLLASGSCFSTGSKCNCDMAIIRVNECWLYGGIMVVIRSAVGVKECWRCEGVIEYKHYVCVLSSHRCLKTLGRIYENRKQSV